MKLLKRICLGTLIMVLLFVLSGFFLIKNTDPLSAAEVIVVLGSPSTATGKTSIIQKSRVNKGIALYQQGLAKKLLFTGGAAWNEFVESKTMKRYAIEKGIPDAAILIETKSNNTDENAKFSYQILKKLGFSKVIVVTSPFHTRRGGFLYKRFPLEVQTAVAPYPYKLRIKDYVMAIANEYFGFLRYFVNSIRGKD